MGPENLHAHDGGTQIDDDDLSDTTSERNHAVWVCFENGPSLYSRAGSGPLTHVEK
jgi:hypothetical protein